LDIPEEDKVEKLKEFIEKLEEWLFLEDLKKFC
jgi:hypothetical protein